MFAVGLSYIAFIMLRYVPSIPAFWRVFFYYKWMLNFVKGFFCIYWDNHMVFIFSFVNVVYSIDWFADSKESLHSWDKAHLVMMYDPFNMLLDSVCKNFVKDFCIYVQLTQLTKKLEHSQLGLLQWLDVAVKCHLPADLQPDTYCLMVIRRLPHI